MINTRHVYVSCDTTMPFKTHANNWNLVTSDSLQLTNTWEIDFKIITLNSRVGCDVSPRFQDNQI